MNLLKFKCFERSEAIRHGVTIRTGGISTGKYNSLNLSLNSGDKVQDVFINRTKVAEEFNVAPGSLYFPDQCHTTNAKWVDDSSSELNETDALITNARQVALGVLSADCVPILFYDPQKEVIAAAHAGWRGTVGGIVSKVIVEMTSVAQCRPEDILVGIGPCIQKENYEIGVEVAEAVRQLGLSNLERILLPSKVENHWHLDLQGLNMLLLKEGGVLMHNVETMPLCTYSNKELFFSARRDGFHTGRFGAVIMLK